MEKRVLLAIVLSFVVLYGYQAMFPPPEPLRPAPSAQGPAPPRGVAADAPAPATTAAPGATPTGEAAPLEQSAAAKPLVADTADRDITFENGSGRAIFSTRGSV